MRRATIALGLALLAAAIAPSARATPSVSNAVGDWATLTTGASFAPTAGAIDPADPNSYLSGGHVVFLQPSVVTGAFAGANPSSIDGLLIRVALSAGTVLSGVRVSLLGANGVTLSSTILQTSSEETPTQTGFGSDPTLSPLSEVMGALVNLGSTAGIAAGGLLATVKFDFLSMSAGSARIDVYGVGASGAIAGEMTDYAAYTAGAAPPPVPEPATAGLFLAGAAALAMARRSRRACPES